MQATTRPAVCSPAIAKGLSGWRSAVEKGNRAFETADYASAVPYYRLACWIADGLFGGADEADTSVAVLVVAHHNLADAYEHLSCPDEQAVQLCAVHERLCLAMDDPHLDECWRLAALRHSRRTYAELTRFVGRHPGHELACAALALGAAGPVSGLRAQ